MPRWALSRNNASLEKDALRFKVVNDEIYLPKMKRWKTCVDRRKAKAQIDYSFAFLKCISCNNNVQIAGQLSARFIHGHRSGKGSQQKKSCSSFRIFEVLIYDHFYH